MKGAGANGEIARENEATLFIARSILHPPHHHQASLAAKAHQEEVLADAAARARARSVAVPTSDPAVRAALRAAGAPVTLFGEREGDRRARLRDLLARLPPAAAAALVAPDGSEWVEDDGTAGTAAQTERFFTEGGQALKAARLALARGSMAAAAARLSRAAGAWAAAGGEAGAAAEAAASAAAAATLAASIGVIASEVGDDRPLSALAFATPGEDCGGGGVPLLLATGSWSGLVKVWSAPGGARLRTLRAHGERVTGLAWRPGGAAAYWEAARAWAGEGGGATPGVGEAWAAAADAAATPSPAALATASADGTARLWSADGALLSTLAGHTARLARCAWHPGGAHLATASYDGAWRLWDGVTGACLLEQEGHAGPVYAVAFHPDGSLAFSGGLDGHARAWDVRSGRAVAVLGGAVRGVLALDASPDGHTVAAGSEDGTARTWDLRAGTAVPPPLAVLPGHASLVCAVRFEPRNGRLLATAGYDGTARLWCGASSRLLRTLAGHEGRVMAADTAVVGGGRGGEGALLLATAGYDRTVKLWGPPGVV